MKHLILAALFFTSQLAWGQQGLTTKGQSQSSLEKTERIQLPFSQVTKLSDKSMLFETGNNNLILDPGFERDLSSTGANGWTSDGNMNCVNNNSLTGFIDLYGVRWLEFDLASATAGYCNSPSVTVPPALAGMPGELKFRTKGGASASRTITITVYDGAGNILKVGDTYLHGLNSTVYVPFIFPLAATSTTVYYRVAASSASGVMQMAIDDVYLGKASGEYNGSVYIPWTNYTPTISAASGTLTNYTLSETQWMRDGENAYYKGRLAFTGAPGTWNTPSFSLPSGQTMSISGQILPMQSDVGLVDVASNTYLAKAATSTGVFNTLYITGYTGPGGGSAVITQAAPFTWVSGDSFYWFVGPVKITEWIGSGQNVMSLNTLPNTTNWAAFTPTGSWSTNTTYAGMWRKVGDTLEVQTKLALAGAPTSASLTVNIPTSICPSIDTAKVTNTVSGASSLGSGVAYDTGSTFYPLQLTYSSTTALNVVVGIASSTYLLNNSVTQAVPITFGNTDIIDVNYRVPCTGWSASVVDMPLVYNTVKTTGNAIKTVLAGSFHGASVGTNCTTGTCGKTADTDSAVTSIAYAGGTGQYTINVASGTCSNFLRCTFAATAVSSGYAFCSQRGASTTTAFLVQCQTGGGSPANVTSDFICTCN